LVIPEDIQIDPLYISAVLRVLLNLVYPALGTEGLWLVVPAGRDIEPVPLIVVFFKVAI
jgi:hypothetical protein